MSETSRDRVQPPLPAPARRRRDASAMPRPAKPVAPATVEHQRAHLRRFARFLATRPSGVPVRMGVAADDLDSRPAAWAGMTRALAEEYLAWQVAEGYTIGGINVGLAIMRGYVRRAREAGALQAGVAKDILEVPQFRSADVADLDDRPARGQRWGPAPDAAMADAVARLKGQPDTPEGRRDAVIICVLADCGLRPNELVRVRLMDVIQAGIGLRPTIAFRTGSSAEAQTRPMPADTAAAIERYLCLDRLHLASDLQESLLVQVRHGHTVPVALSTQAIRMRVRIMGEVCGIAGLSPFDCRRTWAAGLAGRVGGDAPGTGVSAEPVRPPAPGPG